MDAKHSMGEVIVPCASSGLISTLRCDASVFVVSTWRWWGNDAPRWFDGGNSVLYLSDRDGSRCIWSQRLNAKTKKPEGAPVAVQHFHSRRFSPVNVLPSNVDLAVGGKNVILNIGELTGNIWIADRAR